MAAGGLNHVCVFHFVKKSRPLRDRLCVPICCARDCAELGRPRYYTKLVTRRSYRSDQNIVPIGKRILAYRSQGNRFVPFTGGNSNINEWEWERTIKAGVKGIACIRICVW